ncbi:hypothetical protein J2736_006827 [Paenibacillus qinlingensis]|uniref:Uncharacterized protein n=2 Tax=Paenibacillus qinlingensis TaxID=1837343 RepID=A0ABU1P727_9BACL|nr:hypothetical protein [Paenibacillus qinlingensis]
MNERKPIKRTTLLIIGVVLFWGSVALWNEINKIGPAPSGTNTTSISQSNPSPHS